MIGLVALLSCVGTSSPAHGQGFSQAAFATFTTNVTLTTTTETTAVTSGPATASRQTANVCVFAWAQLTTGTATTTVTPRIRRGADTTGTLVGEANAVTIGAAAGSTEQFLAMVCEDRADVATVDYTFTLQQASATGNGTALQGGILVLVR
jgi:hypothetical protein